MPKLNDDEVERFLAEREILMRIAVVREDGSPLVTPIWFLNEDGAIYFTPRRRSEWFDCLRRDPRAALCIDESDQPYRKVLVEGTAELLHDIGEDDAWRDLYRRIAERYTSPEGADAYIRNTIDQPRGLYRVLLATSKVTTWRMPVPGEAGEGIWHHRYYEEGRAFRNRIGGSR